MPPPLTTHRIWSTDVGALAVGGHGLGALPSLRAGQRSKLLTVLRALMDCAASDDRLPGPLPPLESAWRLLAKAQHRDSAAVEQVLGHPQTGMWAAHSLRRLRGSITDQTPLWVAVGQLHAVAAAAALHAGLSFHTEVPLRDGCLLLPTLGMATLAVQQPWAVAQLQHDARGTRISAGNAAVTVPADPGDDSAGWLGTRRLHLESGGMPLEVCLDDLDPHRGLAEPLPPQRLTATELRAWHERLADTWALLVRDHPGTALELSAGMSALVPRPMRNRFRPSSATSVDGFGCAGVALPADPAVLAAMLVHEFWHSKLNALLDLVHLVHGADRRDRFYAPWRDDPRPVIGLLHGTYSFLGVGDFWRVHRGVASGAPARLAAVEFALRRQQVGRAVDSLRGSGMLTELGTHFVAAMAERVRCWQSEAIPADLLRLAERMETDHYATWRLRHLRPDPGLVAVVAADWLSGAGPDTAAHPAAQVRSDPAAGTEPRPRTHLQQLALGEPELFAQLTPDTLAEHVPGAGPADLLLVRGDPAAAAAGYRERLRADPADYLPWIGLGLANAALGNHTVATALLHRPELVGAVHHELGQRGGTPPDPEALAAWLGSGAPTGNGR